MRLKVGIGQPRTPVAQAVLPVPSRNAGTRKLVAAAALTM